MVGNSGLSDYQAGAVCRQGRFCTVGSFGLLTIDCASDTLPGCKCTAAAHGLAEEAILVFLAQHATACVCLSTAPAAAGSLCMILLVVRFYSLGVARSCLSWAFCFLVVAAGLQPM